MATSSKQRQASAPKIGEGVGNKKIMFIRHAEDEVHGVRACATKFRKWHNDRVKSAGEAEGAVVDPCLTDRGIAALTTGVDDDERDELNAMGYGGMAGGLQQHVKQFNPQVILSSPMSRSLQSALVAFDWSKAPIVVHYGLKEIKADYTKGGTLPKGKPGVRCMPVSYLKETAARHPRSSKGAVDWTIMENELELDDWFDPTETHQSMCKKLEKFREHLTRRRENRIAVVTHGGVLRKLLGLGVGHSEFGIVDVRDIGDSITTPVDEKPGSAQEGVTESHTMLRVPSENNVFAITELSPGTRVVAPPGSTDELENKRARRAVKDAYAAKVKRRLSADKRAAPKTAHGPGIAPSTTQSATQVTAP